MPDLPAPQHSATLNALLDLPPADTAVGPAPALPAPLNAIPRLEAERHRHDRRRRAAARARARRDEAA